MGTPFSSHESRVNMLPSKTVKSGYPIILFLETPRQSAQRLWINVNTLAERCIRGNALRLPADNICSADRRARCCGRGAWIRLVHKLSTKLIILEAAYQWSWWFAQVRLSRIPFLASWFLCGQGLCTFWVGMGTEWFVEISVVKHGVGTSNVYRWL
jgi:hypothetical protein